ncbi:unnamed protein product [Nezara viridula]|uniref:Uncharacterized protein n=1 Tax=Nezara viridula TaxID=85310 RepID=A0A9P0H2Z1_NEZVI|nr:unnamed protein product [Nezara viridula]
MNNTGGVDHNAEPQKKQDPPKGHIQACFERTGLTPKTFIALVAFSTAYIFLYVIVGSSCLGSIIFVISFLFTFACIFFLLWITCRSYLKKGNPEEKPVSKPNQEVVTNDPPARYQSTGAVEEQKPLTSAQEEE